eukprot:6201137-Pleurochrysis_carterae.AAC.1
MEACRSPCCCVHGSGGVRVRCWRLWGGGHIGDGGDGCRGVVAAIPEAVEVLEEEAVKADVEAVKADVEAVATEANGGGGPTAAGDAFGDGGGDCGVGARRGWRAVTSAAVRTGKCDL